jgi:hypothetical protein
MSVRVRDILRLVRELGLTVRFPPPGDPDWAPVRKSDAAG